MICQRDSDASESLPATAQPATDHRPIASLLIN